MKKLIYLLLFLFIPLNVHADEIDYDITNYYINADILENGDLEVSELIVLNGTFNGYQRDVAYTNSILTRSSSVDFEHDAIYNAAGIKNYSAYAKHVKNVSFNTMFDNDFDTLSIIKGFEGGRSGDLGILSQNDMVLYRMYYRTDHAKTAFLLKYTVDSAVVMHEDVAELYWTFIGNDFTDPIKNLKIKVNLPDKDTSEDFRVWAHIDSKKNVDDLIGEIKKYDDSYVLAETPKLTKNSPVDIRLTFDKDLITDDSNLDHSYVEATDKILEVETKRANEANAIRKKYKKIYKIALIASSIGVVYQLLSIIYIYFRYDKEYESDFISDYNREFIDDYNVEVVDYIMNKNITPNAMSASIMNLIYKKNITAEKIIGDKKNEYKFTFLNFDNVTEEEKILIDFLFNKVGNQKEFTTIELKNYAKSTKTYNKFTSSFTRWKNSVIQKGKQLGIYESHTGVTLYAALVMGICIFLYFVFSSFGALNFMLIIDILLSIGIFIYTLTFNKRTKYGNEQYVRWKAFKKFLVDFGTFDVKELPELPLWERYMVYATVLGVAKKVARDMNVKIKEMNVDESSLTFTDYYFYNSLSRDLSNSINSAVNLANATRAAEIASSSMSSGSGGGGGFSSGGGFGGGGGGGHGF